MLSAYSDSYASYFSLQIFFSLSLYLWLFFSFTLFHELGLLIQCQIKMVIMNIFVFFLHLRRKNVQYFRVKSDVTRRLFVSTLYQTEEVSFYFQFAEILFIKVVVVLLILSTQLRKSMVFFLFYVTEVNYIIFLMSNQM